MQDLSLKMRLKSQHELLQIVELCEAALLDGTSSDKHMSILIESEKELLRREHSEVKRDLAKAQRDHASGDIKARLSQY